MFKECFSNLFVLDWLSFPLSKVSQLTNIYFIDTFNNREKAIAIWLFVILAWAYTKNKEEIRKSILNVFKSLFLTKFSFVFMGTIVYVTLIIMLLYKAKLWNFLLIKDTIFWILGAGFVLLLNANKALQDHNYFRTIVVDTLKLTVVLEFISNLYTFDFWVEMIFMPFLFLIVAMDAYAGKKEEYKPVKKLTNRILGIVGFYMILFALFQIVSNYHSFPTLYNLKTFILPPILTIFYIPFLYIFVLIMAYEALFVRLDILIRENKALAKYTKLQVFNLCLLNLNKLNRFIQENNSNFLGLANKKDVMKIIEQFRTKR